MAKYLRSVKEIKIAVLDKIKSIDATIASIKTEIQFFQDKIEDLKSKKQNSLIESYKGFVKDFNKKIELH